MTAPYVKVFTVGGKQLTSVIVDQDDFDRAIATLEGVIQVNANNKRADIKMLQDIRDAKHLPMAARGTKTEALFQMFGVKTDLMSLAVRGLANRLGIKRPGDSNHESN